MLLVKVSAEMITRVSSFMKVSTAFHVKNGEKLLQECFYLWYPAALHKHCGCQTIQLLRHFRAVPRLSSTKKQQIGSHKIFEYTTPINVIFVIFTLPS